MDNFIEKIEHSSKSKDALRTIGEVADLILVEQHVIRFWESKFPQVKPRKNRGIRYYTLRDIELLFRIKTYLYDEGYTIKGVQQLLIKNHQPLAKSFPENTDLSNNVLVSKEQLMMIIKQLNSVRSKLIVLRYDPDI